MKLFAISIVAKSLFGFCNKSNIVNFFSCFSIPSMSLELNEKNATSAPETKADKTISIKITRLSNNTLTSKI